MSCDLCVTGASHVHIEDGRKVVLEERARVLLLRLLESSYPVSLGSDAERWQMEWDAYEKEKAEAPGGGL